MTETQPHIFGGLTRCTPPSDFGCGDAHPLLLAVRRAHAPHTRACVGMQVERAQVGDWGVVLGVHTRWGRQPEQGRVSPRPQQAVVVGGQLPVGWWVMQVAGGAARVWASPACF